LRVFGAPLRAEDQPTEKMKAERQLANTALSLSSNRCKNCNRGGKDSLKRGKKAAEPDYQKGKKKTSKRKRIIKKKWTRRRDASAFRIRGVSEMEKKEYSLFGKSAPIIKEGERREEEEKPRRRKQLRGAINFIIPELVQPKHKYRRRRPCPI